MLSHQSVMKFYLNVKLNFFKGRNRASMPTNFLLKIIALLHVILKKNLRAVLCFEPLKNL